MCLSLNEFERFSFLVHRMTDLLVGAPMFMVRGSDSRLEEMGRVYVYLQRGPLNLELLPSHLTGTQVFGRYGSTIAPLGDLNLDGFNGKNGDRIKCKEACQTRFMVQLIFKWCTEEF